MNTGKPSQKIFEDILESMGKRAWFHRLTDSAEVNSRVRGPHKVAVKSQPCDYIVVLDGEVFFAEVKSTGDPGGAGLNLKRPSQVAFSRRIEAAGGKYYYFIHNLVADRWYRVTASEFTTKQGWDSLELRGKMWPICKTA